MGGQITFSRVRIGSLWTTGRSLEEMVILVALYLLACLEALQKKRLPKLLSALQ